MLNGFFVKKLAMTILDDEGNEHMLELVSRYLDDCASDDDDDLNSYMTRNRMRFDEEEAIVTVSEAAELGELDTYMEEQGKHYDAMREFPNGFQEVGVYAIKDDDGDVSIIVRAEDGLELSCSPARMTHVYAKIWDGAADIIVDKELDENHFDFGERYASAYIDADDIELEHHEEED